MGRVTKISTLAFVANHVTEQDINVSSGGAWY
jgi:hypothetical protein